MIAIDLRRALQRFADAAADIFRTNVAFELGLPHQLRGLLACSAEKQGASRIMQRVGQVTNGAQAGGINRGQDRKSTRLNSSHQIISYAVFCLKKKNQSLLKRLRLRPTHAP